MSDMRDGRSEVSIRDVVVEITETEPWPILPGELRILTVTRVFHVYGVLGTSR